MLVTFWSTFLLQIFCQLCFRLKDLIKIVWLVLAAVSINGLISAPPEIVVGKSHTFEKGNFGKEDHFTKYLKESLL